MVLQSIKADEVKEIARRFRTRAAEAQDTVYHALMLRTAAELEELADTLASRDDTTLALIGDEDGDECPI